MTLRHTTAIKKVGLVTMSNGYLINKATAKKTPIAETVLIKNYLLTVKHLSDRISQKSPTVISPGNLSHNEDVPHQ